MIFFKLLITAAMLIIGAFLLMDQQLNLGQFIAAEIVILTVLAAVEKLILSLDKAYDLLTSIDKLTKVTDKEIETGGSMLFRPNNLGIALHLENLTVGFDESKPILSGINLSMMPGEKVCVMGDASSGKSTLLEVVTGALQHQQGSVLVNGIPIGNYQPDAYRKHIGVFYHDQDIFQGTLLENITMGDPAIEIQALMPMVEMVGLKSFLSSLPAGFDTLLQPTGKGLSSIIAKKILLLRAFAGNPELLLLDEPFEMAGGEQWRKIEHHLLELKNTSMLVVTGNIEFAKQCDKLVILESGKVKKSGSPLMILQEEGKI